VKKTRYAVNAFGHGGDEMIKTGIEKKRGGGNR